MPDTSATTAWNRGGRVITPKWTTANMPSQKGRSVVVTGTRGLGFETALELARAGADVIIAGRSLQGGADAVERIRAEVSSASIRFEQLDLASLDSVKAFADRLRTRQGGLDVLINNAAVMSPPKREETVDGYELQFGTNYLGHFALTLQLLPLLSNRVGARVVSLSSVAARQGAINFDDLQATAKYDAMQTYSQSKLACLMFAFELQRRSEGGRWGVSSIAAHPGISKTDLLLNAPGSSRLSVRGVMRTLLGFMFQPVSQGALPTLFAATSPEAEPGGYYGPNRMSETRGFPSLSKIPLAAQDTKTAARLWAISEQLANVSVPVLESASSRGRLL